MTDLPENVLPQAEPPKTPQKATLLDLECATITVVVTLADDAEVTVPMRLIPQYRMMQLSAMIPSAVPPQPVDAVKAADGGVKWIYNYNDPAYIAEASEVAYKRNALMLAEMIQIDIPGETLEECATYIRDKFDPLVTDQLTSVIGMQREKAKARIITRAETFH
jgi:hypothetical protein